MSVVTVEKIYRCDSDARSQPSEELLSQDGGADVPRSRPSGTSDEICCDTSFPPVRNVTWWFSARVHTRRLRLIAVQYSKRNCFAQIPIGRRQ